MNEELRICYIVTNKENMNIKKERYYTYYVLHNVQAFASPEVFDEW